MLILHAGVDQDRFLIWGEQPPVQTLGAHHTSSGPATSKGKSKSTSAKPFPYDAGHQVLAAALAEVLTGFRVEDFPAETAIAWLPSVDGSPIASSPLIDETAVSKGRAVAGKSHQPRILPWQVTVISIPVSAAFDLFCACPGKQTLAPGVVIGADLTYWAAATRFAGAIVAREQFLPTLEIKGDSPRARWEPVLAPADAARVAQLAHAMPQVCRALASPKGSMRTKARRRGPSAPPDIPAHLVLTAFLAELVDYMVRSASAQDAGVIGGRTASSSRPKNAAGFASVHDQWFAALRSDAGTMSGSEVELARLSDQVREWQRPVSVTRSTPFRLCFRLEEPEEPEQAGWQAEETAELPLPERHNRIDDRSTSANGQTEPDATPPAPWRVRYLLQASDDPSLLVPVPEAWSANGHHTSVLKRGSFKPREYLLSSLGQAAKLNSQIEESLRSPAPWGYDLDSAGAYRFLSEQAWLLEQSGFGVLLPAWWTRKGTKLRLSSRARVQSPAMKSSGGISLDDIVTFDWEVLLGGQELSLEELEMLARLKSPLVRLRGQWVQISGAEIEAALAFWKNRSRGRAKVREIMQMALGAESAPGELPLEEVAATGWIGELLSQLEGGRPFEEQPPPDEFNGVLRPYQVRGYSWLGFLKRWGLGACLADDMGLGKTPQTLALIQREWITNGKRPTLVICPMSVVGNWQKEATRFAPDLPVMIHHGMARTKGPAFKKAAGKHALVLSSFSLLHRDLDLLKQVDWAGIVLDEAQNIKNPQTKQAQAARLLKADFRIALTGTPVENNVGDLWSIMEFLNPGMLGSQAEFKRTFFLPIQSKSDPSAAQRLKKLTGPFILRRLKTDKTIIADLPDKMEMKVFCTLTKEQASLYAAVVDDVTRSLEESDGIQRKGIVLATLSKLKQVCNHPAQFLGDNSPIPSRSGKLERLTEMLEEVLAEGDRALVFTQFAEMGHMIRRHLQEKFGREALFLHGQVAKKNRDLMVSRFQNDDNGPPIFILSLKAGGTGLNLTKANHVFHFDRWWNPAVENQATDRAFRIGQKKNVQVHKFLCAGTLEEKIDEMIERKRELASKIVGSGEGWLTELSTSELKELFALRPSAVAGEA